MDFKPGDRVVLKQGLPQRQDHVGTVTSTGDDEVWVQWAGPEAPPSPRRYVPRALEMWEPASS